MIGELQCSPDGPSLGPQFPPIQHIYGTAGMRELWIKELLIDRTPSTIGAPPLLTLNHKLPCGTYYSTNSAQLRSHYVFISSQQLEQV